MQGGKHAQVVENNEQDTMRCNRNMVGDDMHRRYESQEASSYTFIEIELEKHKLGCSSVSNGQ